MIDAPLVVDSQKKNENSSLSTYSCVTIAISLCLSIISPSFISNEIGDVCCHCLPSTLIPSAPSSVQRGASPLPIPTVGGSDGVGTSVTSCKKGLFILYLDVDIHYSHQHACLTWTKPTWILCYTCIEVWCVCRLCAVYGIRPNTGEVSTSHTGPMSSVHYRIIPTRIMKDNIERKLPAPFTDIVCVM